VALKGLHGLAFGLQDEVLVKVTPTKQFALFIRSLLLHSYLTWINFLFLYLRVFTTTLFPVVVFPYPRCFLPLLYESKGSASIPFVGAVANTYTLDKLHVILDCSTWYVCA